MPEGKISCKQRIEYYLFQALTQAIRFSPRWARSWERRFFVCSLKWLDPKHSRIISDNLQIVFPDRSPQDRARIKNEVYRHFISILLEIIRTFARSEMSSILERSTIRHAERLSDALKKNSGLLVISAHFGNWEWIPLLLSHHLGEPINSIARPMDNPLIEKKVSEFRTACGSTIIHKQGSLRKMISLLGENKVVYMLADLNTVQREAIFVDFFSRTAATGTTAARLYFKKHIPVIPLFLHYEGERIILDVREEIDFPETGNLKNDVSLFTLRINAFIEEAIRKNPEQWFWFHNRWKTQP